MSSSSGSPFSILVVGAGITGLAAALCLAQHGHHVHVIERRKEGFAANLGGGIQLTKNSTRIIDAMGLYEQLLDFSTTHKDVTVRKYKTGAVLRTITKRNPSHMVHRADVVRMFYRAAERLGVHITLGRAVVAIDVVGPRPVVRLDDDSTVEADLVLGADGIESKVRKMMFPTAEPIMQVDCTFLVSVPRSAIEKSVEAPELYKLPNYQIFLGPGRDIICWTMRNRDIYHLQFNDHQHGREHRSLGSWTEPYDDLEGFRRRWSDFAPAIQHILAETTDVWKWKIAEAPELPRWSSETGNVILIGDAAHAIPPYAGQGANLGIEDGAAIAALISEASGPTDVSEVARVYEEVRMPRVRTMLEIVR